MVSPKQPHRPNARPSSSSRRTGNLAPVLPAENGRRRRYPSIGELRQSTMDEMGSLQEGLLGGFFSSNANEALHPRASMAGVSPNEANYGRGGPSPSQGQMQGQGFFEGAYAPVRARGGGRMVGQPAPPFFGGNGNMNEGFYDEEKSRHSDDDLSRHSDDGQGAQAQGGQGRPSRGGQGQGGFNYIGTAFKVIAICALLTWLPLLGDIPPLRIRSLGSSLSMQALMPTALSESLQEFLPFLAGEAEGESREDGRDGDVHRPEFVYEHPYVSSSYYTSTRSMETLLATNAQQVVRNIRREAEAAAGMESDGHPLVEAKTKLAIVRPFCEFDAEALPTTFTCWNALPPCKAASADVGDDDDEDFELDIHGQLVSYNANTTRGRALYSDYATGGDRHTFDLVGSDAMRNARADVFLFYSQTFSENDVAIKAVDEIIDQFFEPGGWSQCFDNIYAIEANIPQELDLYIPSAQEELYNWVNGPNRQFEAAFRIIQSGEWGDYDGFYLMEGDSVPIKAHWLDVVLSEIEVNRPFAILGAQYDGDKWDNFYEKIPISLLHHTNGNAIYNTSHPLLERLVGQLEVEAPCPYNSIPYDYRMSQMWVEGTLGIVPDLAPKIMLNEEGENITLSDNRDMFGRWAETWEGEGPFKYTPVIHNYAATNLIPRHLGPEYIIHGAKLYSPWNPTKTDVTLVVSEWFFDRSSHLVKNLDEKDHPFSEVVIMVPPVAGSHDDYDEMTDVPVRTQHRGAPDFMDLCEADVHTEWFMMTNSYHHVARHVDLMFTPGTFKPVIPFTPATYAFCFKYPYCKETVNLAQRINPGQDKVIQDMDMLYHTASINKFCEEWKRDNGEEGEDLYKRQQRRLMFRKKIIGPPGPTGTGYFAWMVKNNKDGMYKMTDRSLYGARPPFVKIFAKEEKLDGMSEDELAKRVGMTLLDNSTDCNCGALETEEECADSGIGCIWRPLFESCHPPELIDGGEPICASSDAPTMAPTVGLPEDDTESPTSAPSEEATLAKDDPWYSSMFKVREHAGLATESNSTVQGKEDLAGEDDDAVLEPYNRKLEADTHDPLYETEKSGKDRLDALADEPPRRKLETKSADDHYRKDGGSSDRLDALADASRRRKLETTESVDDGYRKNGGSSSPKKTPVDSDKPAHVKSDKPQKANVQDEPLKKKSDPAAEPSRDKTPPVSGSLDRPMEEHPADEPKEKLPSEEKPIKELLSEKKQPKDLLSDKKPIKEHETTAATADHTSKTDKLPPLDAASLQDVVARERKLEATLKDQDAKKEQKARILAMLRKEEMQFKSELLRLEMQLEKTEMKTLELMTDLNEK